MSMCTSSNYISQNNFRMSLLDKRLIEIELERKNRIKEFDEEKKEILHAKYVLSKYQNHDTKELSYQNEISNYMANSINRCLKRIQVIIKIILFEDFNSLSIIKEKLNQCGDPIGYNSLQVNVSKSSELSLDGKGNVLIVK